MSSINPVVIYPPHDLKFYLRDNCTLKKQLTIFNTFTHPVRFEVETTANIKYKIIDPIGTISPHCKMQIFIRYLSPSLDQCNTIDKFRISLYKGNTKECIGVKILNSILLDDVPDSTFEELVPNYERLESKSTSTEHMREEKNNSINPVAVVTAVICLTVIIVLPSPYENNPSIVYSYISTNIKIYCSFLLGLITMYFWKSGTN